MKPDAIVLAVYAGNDFVSTPFGGWMRPPIAELPLPSLLAGPAPRTTWLAVNRLGLSEFGRNNKIIDGEFAQLNEWLKLPADERLDRIVQHLKRNYYPRLERRGDPRDPVARRRQVLDGLRQAAPRPRVPRRLAAVGHDRLGDRHLDHAARLPRRPTASTARAMVDETLSWLVAADRLAKENGVQLVVALIPVGTVDPAYVDFWRPWPKYFSTSLSADARHRRLAVKLRQTAVPFFDLRDDLGGVPGTYRLTDGHWTERGTEIVAGRMSRELMKMRATSR